MVMIWGSLDFDQIYYRWGAEVSTLEISSWNPGLVVWQHQAISWANADQIPTWASGRYLDEISNNMQIQSMKYN